MARTILSTAVIGLVIATSTVCVAQIDGVRKGSAEAARRIDEYRRRAERQKAQLAEYEHRYEASKVVKAARIKTPSEEDIARDIATRSVQQASLTQTLEERIKDLSTEKRTKQTVAAIAELREQLTEINSNSFMPRLFIEDLDVGKIGLLVDWDGHQKLVLFQVAEVIDDANMILSYGKSA